MSERDRNEVEYRWSVREHVTLLRFVARWFLICVPLGLAVGSAVALFLWSLDRVTQVQWQTPWLLFLLPVAGAVSGLMYRYFGGTAERGNNLILEQIHEPGGGVPARMAPLVLIGTLITHLFGGSAGREGTAVQMGGSIASTLGRVLPLKPHDHSTLLMCGVAAGFGAVFGTPLTGAVFSLEVLAIGVMNYRALIPCLIAGVIGDQVTTAWGITHTHYLLSFGKTVDGAAGELLRPALLDGWLVAKVAVAGICFGGVSVIFVQLTHGVSAILKRLVPIAWLRPVVGACGVILLVWLLGTRDYLGLGVSGNPNQTRAISIQSCFVVGGVTLLSWWWKSLMTSITVGSGFKGGEVTPLFFIGAAAGNILASIMGAPVDLIAAIGFVAVFAGATNTPVACTIMALELFAPHSPDVMRSGFVVYAAIGCFLSYFVSGHSSLYQAQKVPGT
ncbi:MAG: voltage-gated chloride channel family protein [Planctomycetaceae bacterium]|nr:voltage-gated chloride channel family protein [Planctomycetaceae bacterium]